MNAERERDSSDMMTNALRDHRRAGDERRRQTSAIHRAVRARAEASAERPAEQEAASASISAMPASRGGGGKSAAL
jgi:hypothetical protein